MAESKEPSADEGKRGLSGLWGFFTEIYKGPVTKLLLVVGLACIVVAILRGIPKVFTISDGQSAMFAILGGALMITSATLGWLSHGSRDGERDIPPVMYWIVGLVLSLLIVLTHFGVIHMPPRYAPRPDIDEVLVALAVASLCGFVPLFVIGRNLRRIPEKQRQFLAELEGMKAGLATSTKDMVDRISDATRIRLKGFHTVFAKALYMIRHAEQELIYVNFVMNFGASHCLSDKVKTAYSELDKKNNLEDDVGEFLTELNTLVDKLPAVKILTVTDSAIHESFLKPLSNRTGYESLKFSETMDKALSEAKSAKDRIRGSLEKPTNVKLKNSDKRVMEEADSLPIQLLITKIRDNDGGPSRRACLVFMVGTDLIEGIEPGGEPAFYTEIDDMIYMFENVATALISAAKKRKNSQAA